MSADIAKIVQHLTDVLTQENEALKRLDYAAAVALSPVKEAALASLTKQPVGQALPPSLVALGRRLGSLAAENQVLLERAIAVQTRIVRIIARAGTPPPAVARYGGYGGRAPSRRAAAMAISTRA
jgi:hypothetical protein